MIAGILDSTGVTASRRVVRYVKKVDTAMLIKSNPRLRKVRLNGCM